MATKGMTLTWTPWDGSPWHCAECNAEVEPGELWCSDLCQEQTERAINGDRRNDERDEEGV